VFWNCLQEGKSKFIRVLDKMLNHALHISRMWWRNQSYILLVENVWVLVNFKKLCLGRILVVKCMLVCSCVGDLSVVCITLEWINMFVYENVCFLALTEQWQKFIWCVWIYYYYYYIFEEDILQNDNYSNYETYAKSPNNRRSEKTYASQTTFFNRVCFLKIIWHKLI
jgi:hypothetical protein